jgi:hypothetical protein
MDPTSSNSKGKFGVRGNDTSFLEVAMERRKALRLIRSWLSVKLFGFGLKRHFKLVCR